MTTGRETLDDPARRRRRERDPGCDAGAPGQRLDARRHRRQRPDASSPTCRMWPSTRPRRPGLCERQLARGGRGGRRGSPARQRIRRRGGDLDAHGRRSRYVGTNWPWQVERVLVEAHPGCDPRLRRAVGGRAHPRGARDVAGAGPRARRGALGLAGAALGAGCRATTCASASRTRVHLPDGREARDNAEPRRSGRCAPSRARRPSGRSPTPRADPTPVRSAAVPVGHDLLSQLAQPGGLGPSVRAGDRDLENPCPRG